MNSLKTISLIQLDGAWCWKKWMELGALRLVANELAQQGKSGRNTGRPHNHTAVEKAAFRYLSNPSVWPDARKDFDYYCQSKGYNNTDEDWNGFLMRAMNHYFVTKPRFRKWLEENRFTHLAKQHLPRIELTKIGLV